MMIVMKPGASEADIESVVGRIESCGARAHLSRGEEVTVIGAIGDREHVQRLGRIHRKREGKHATLYELIASGTSEEYVSQKRRDHVAYH